MTSQVQPRYQTGHGQIVIEQQPEYSDVQEKIQFQRQDIFYRAEEETDKHPRFAEAIRINKDKLFRYDPQREKYNNVLGGRQFSNKSNMMKNAQSSSIAFNLPNNKSNSIKTLKQIKHKIESSSKKLKTQEEKQNDLQIFLPKVNKTFMNQSSKAMNKTTSSMNFKKIRTPQFQALTVQYKKPFFNNQANMIKQNLYSQVKQQYNDFNRKLNSNRSENKMSKSLTKAASLSKFRGTNNGQNQPSCNPGQIKNLLNQMNGKQEALLEEKNKLQERLQALRDGIEKQATLLGEINKNKRRISLYMTRKEQLSRYSTDGANLSKKKSQNFQVQARNLQQKLNQTNIMKNKLVDSIQDEKQLIRMYQLVIEEVKSQLKMEKQDKIELQKKLAIMKKNQKSLQSKVIAQQATNRQIFRKIYLSLQKWQ